MSSKSPKHDPAGSSANNKPATQQLSKDELDRVTEVFKMYETGLREATIYPKDLHQAMKQLGLNPTETEIQDLINEVERNGFIYYPAFCKIIMRKFREDPEETFHQELFRTLVGPKCYPPSQVAALYNINKEFLTFEQFKTIMQNLPEYVSDDDVKTMFGFADKDNNGYISYKEFTLMVDVPKCEVIPAAPEPTSESGGGTTSATTTTTTAVSTTAVANGVGAKPVETIVTMSTAGATSATAT